MAPEQLLVFIDSNLGTHFATPVSQDSTIGNLKGQLEREHSWCFPNFGEIRVYALMLKHNSCHYQLPDSLLIKNAFEGFEGTWFLWMDATRVECLNSHAEPMENISTVGERDHLDNAAFEKSGTDTKMQREHDTPRKADVKLVCKEKNKDQTRKNQSMSFEGKEKKRLNNHESSKYVVEEIRKMVVAGKTEIQEIGNSLKRLPHKEKRELLFREETPVASSSSVLPVSGIITRYFPKSDDGESEDIQNGGKVGEMECSEQSTERQRPMHGKWEVGKRIVLAKRNLTDVSESFPLRKKKRKKSSNIHRLLMEQKVSQFCLLQEANSSYEVD